MGNSHAIVPSGATISIVLLGVWAVWSPSSAFRLSSVPSAEKEEGTYRGQPTSFWLNQLQSRDVSCRVMATQALEQIGPTDEHVVPALTEMLKDPSKEVRLAAAFALRGLGSEAQAAIPSLILALKDQDPLMRINAACALRSIQAQDERVIAALIPMLEDDSPIVRRTILRIMRGIGPAAEVASPAVRKALADTPKD